MIDRNRLAELNQRELATFAERNPKSRAAYEKAEHLFGRVPMTWMNKKLEDFRSILIELLAIEFGTSTAMNTLTSL